MPRKKLPNRRPSQVFEFTLKGFKYTCQIGYYDKAMQELGEVFISCGKSGSDSQLVLLEAAIAVSLLLQHGGSIHELAKAMPHRDDGSPEGPLGTLLSILSREEAKDAREELLT